VIYHNLIDDQKSVHLTAWPQVPTQLRSEKLEEEMDVIRKVAEAVHGTRKEQGIKVRQPLASVTVTSSVESPTTEILDVLSQEVNVKEVKWQSGDQFAVEVDTTLTPELKAEGEAREVMRQVQQLRKEAGVQMADWVNVQLPNWPKEWEEQIKSKTKVKELKQGAEAKILS
jgi:isoleucyl-tRNA synthetase